MASWPQGIVHAVAFDPLGRWLASGSSDATICLWPIPEGQPFQTLPYDESLAHLKALTDCRVVPDPDSESGHRLDIDTFAGWENVPTW